MDEIGDQLKNILELTSEMYKIPDEIEKDIEYFSIEEEATLMYKLKVSQKIGRPMKQWRKDLGEIRNMKEGIENLKNKTLCIA